MLKLGIIGMSEGNGHPYSWSAIINGNYRDKEMEQCGFAGIPVYLAANRDTLGIDSARVTHVWTQDRKQSEHIARASLIDNVTDSREEMIGEVDAVILARDDPETHVEMAKPFLDADVPLFIDKPLAGTQEDLDYFIDQHKKGKFFMSCSSMRYAAENRTARQKVDALGAIELVTAVVKKDWLKYGVHILEGLLALLGDPKVITVRNVGKDNRHVVYLELDNGIQVTIHVFVDIAWTCQLSLFGENGSVQIEYSNWYQMFRENLVEFIRSVEQGKSRLPFSSTENIIRAIIAGQESLKQNGASVIPFP